MTHGTEICPAYGMEFLDNGNGNCSLCGALPIHSRIDCPYCKHRSYPIDTKFKSNIKAHLATHKENK